VRYKVTEGQLEERKQVSEKGEIEWRRGGKGEEKQKVEENLNEERGGNERGVRNERYSWKSWNMTGRRRKISWK
jgi:hypothetical protein